MTRRGKIRLLAAALAAAAPLLAPAVAGAQAFGEPLGPWNGANPFNCKLQSVGTGTDFPDPDADPFCVEFDKTSQNITDFGLVDFLAQEPARVAAAVDKCFYYQHDHWTGSIVQGQPPELWNWDGSYFFDRAKGVGGAHVTNFRVAGVPMDATPFAPEQYHPWLSPTGGGGVIVLLETEPDPTCAARVATPEGRQEVYADEPKERDCIKPGGKVQNRRIGRARLGLSPAELHDRLGEPRRRAGSVHRWCLTGGAGMRVRFAAREGGAPRGAALIRTSNPGHSVRRVGPGARRAPAIRTLGLERGPRVGKNRVFSAEPRPRFQLHVGIRGKRVRWLAISDPHRLHTPARLRAAVAKTD